MWCCCGIRAGADDPGLVDLMRQDPAREDLAGHAGAILLGFVDLPRVFHLRGRGIFNSN